MKKLLRKKIGGKRHREWAWAAVFIALCTTVVALWGSQEPQMTPADSMVNAGNAPGLVRQQGSAVQAPAVVDTSVVGVLAGIPEASNFNAYVHSTGVANQLRNGSYTIFIPTNAAISNLPKGTISGLSSSAQTRLVQYHVVSGKMLDNDAIMSGNYQAMSRDTLNFNVNIETGASYVNSGKIIKQYKASNGIIYLVSSVLFPPK
jgi:uncharacterized surface protein with fasciclin (FAS1) repeats